MLALCFRLKLVEDEDRFRHQGEASLEEATDVADFLAFPSKGDVPDILSEFLVKRGYPLRKIFPFRCFLVDQQVAPVKGGVGRHAQDVIRVPNRKLAFMFSHDAIGMVAEVVDVNHFGNVLRLPV